jgi:hypothetical protein
MDGVLADMDSWLDAQPGLTDDNMWEYVKKVDHFYLHLKPMPEAFLLMEYLQGLEIPLAILTALPRRDSVPDAESDKHKWIQKYFGDMEFHVGPYAKDKQKRSKPGQILIDDSLLNVPQWNSKGGKAFLYKGFMPFYDQFERFRRENG